MKPDSTIPKPDSGAAMPRPLENRPPDLNLAEFIIRVEAENANVDIPLLRRAYEFSEMVHAGQKRESGEPYINHCLAVAMILAEQHLDTATITAGLIHDVVEDTPYGIDAVRERFGEEIAHLVDGVTKISGVKYQSHAEQQVEYFRKMLISMARDIRVIIIKLADRLHNMRTLEYLPPAKRERIALETREVYAPLAHRFGMAKIKWELEDLSLKYLHPDAYRDIAEKVELKREEREAYIQEVITPLKAGLDKEGIETEISGRAKHLDSIYRKMVKRRKAFEEIYDLLAIRVIVPYERDCYHALGVIHTLWTPVVDRFHDYIATPKTNMYQSLHTTVIGPRGRMVEIQIRTREMHYTAEFGIASHWLYKEGKREFDRSDRQMSWLREVLEWQKDTRDPKEFLELFKTDLFHEEIYVFTPNGDLKPLPAGATPVDFAYAVHTAVGHRCVGAKVNGHIVPLTYQLHSGDEVEIITSNQIRPSRDWLSFVVTSRARSKIRQHFNKVEFDHSVELGRDLLAREAKRTRLPMPNESTLHQWALELNHSGVDSLLAALGSGIMAASTLFNRFYPRPAGPEVPAAAETVERPHPVRGVRIQNLDNMMFRFANCCQPVPGEAVVGYITRGRGVTVHRANCVNVLALHDRAERRIEVEWDVSPDQSFLVRLNLTMENRKHLLRDITQAIADAETDIQGVSLSADRATGMGSIDIQVRNLQHLSDIMRRIRGVAGVLGVERASGKDGQRNPRRPRDVD
jgi:GTP pyrophosphokinase